MAPLEPGMKRPTNEEPTSDVKRVRFARTTSSTEAISLSIGMYHVVYKRLLIVLITTDCLQLWTPIRFKRRHSSGSLPNSRTTRSVPMRSLAAMRISISRWFSVGSASKRYLTLNTKTKTTRGCSPSSEVLPLLLNAHGVGCDCIAPMMSLQR